MNNNITPEFCVALAKMQPLLPTIPKSATNPHFKSKFAPHDALIGLTTKLLAEYGFSIIQSFHNDEVVSVSITDDKGGEAKTAVSNLLITYLLHSSGGYIVSHLNIGAVDKMLNYGALITYFRRYAHFAILGIVGDIDDDGASVTPSPSQVDALFTPVAQPAFTPAVSQKRKLI